MLLKTILSWIIRNWQGVLLLAGGIWLIFSVQTCQNRKARIDELETEVSGLKNAISSRNEHIDNLKRDTARIGSLYRDCRKTMKSSIDSFTRQKQERVRVRQQIRQFVQSATPEQKRDTILKIVQSLDTVSVQAEPLGYIEVKGKQIPYYTDAQENLIAWAVLEGQFDRVNTENTDRAGATYKALLGSLKEKVIPALKTEADRSRFLWFWFGRRKFMREQVNALDGYYNNALK